MSTETAKSEAIDARWIEQNRLRPGIDEARIVGTGVPVWALIGYLEAAAGDCQRVAADYGLPEEAIQAAISYYEKHRAVIDARLAANAAYFE